MANPSKSKVEEPLTYDPELGPDYFVQIPQSILKNTGISDGAFRLYCVLLLYCRQKMTAWPGQELLAEDLGCSVRQVQRRLVELREIGLVDWVQLHANASNRYHIYKAPLRGRKNISTETGGATNMSSLEATKTSGLAATKVSPETHALESHKEEQQQQRIADDVILKKLEQEGLSAKTSEKLEQTIHSNGRTANYLIELISYIRQQSEIRSPQAYLRRMIEDNADVPKPLSPADRLAAQDAAKMAKWKKEFNHQ